jgi:hypothetical protein
MIPLVPPRKLFALVQENAKSWEIEGRGEGDRCEIIRTTPFEIDSASTEYRNDNAMELQMETVYVSKKGSWSPVSRRLTTAKHTAGPERRPREHLA